MPDYSKQLEEIVMALNRPGWPIWLVATFSAVLGIIGGLVGQVLMMLIKDKYDRHKLRRTLYIDLAYLFLRVSMIINMEPEDIPWENKAAWYQDQLRRGLIFRGEKECVDNPALYLQLPERFAGETLYPRFHRIIDDLETAPNAIDVNTRAALNLFARFINDGVLQRKYFKRYLVNSSADKLFSIVNEHNKKADAPKKPPEGELNW